MAFLSWRGTIGLIKPTLRPGGLEEFIRLLPEGIGVLPLFVNVRRGTADEFLGVLPAFEARVQELAEADVDWIHPEGAPPFMVHGYAGERKIIDGWQEKYSKPIVTAPMTQVDALRALGVRKILGVTYFPGDINRTFAQYFEDAGFEVLAMEGIDVAFEQAGGLSAHEVYGYARRAWLKHQDAEAVYLLGSGWRVLDIVDMLEQDLGIPVVHAMTARLWAVQNALHVRQPIPGYGRLLIELPPTSVGAP
ncbi:MAG: aspartate/glutamate racemase family protein [Chloroflexota bacterium]